MGLFNVNERPVGLYSVDVAGHGVASALMTARIAGLLNQAAPDRNIALTIDEAGNRSMLPPHEVCGQLNDLLMTEIDTDRYLTMVLADIDLETGHIVMCQCGHPSPAIQRKDGQIEFVSSFGLPIGLIPNATYTSFEAVVEHGERLLLYSDGLTECPLEEEDDLLDEEGLAKILYNIRGVSGPEAIDAITLSLTEISGLQEFPDDLSAILFQRY